MSLKKAAIQGFKWTSFASLLIALLQFIQLAIIARYLDPVDFGLMALTLAILDIIMVNADLGISASIIHKQQVTKSELSSLYWVNVISGFIIFFFILFLRPYLVVFFREPKLDIILLWVSFSFLITPIGSQFNVLLIKYLHFDIIAKITIISQFLQTFSVIILAIKGYGVWSLVIGYMIGVCARTAILVIYCWKMYHPYLHFSFFEIKKHLSFGIYQIGSRTLGTLSDKLAHLTIGFILGTEQLGLYSFAYNLVQQPIYKIVPAITQVIFPVFSKIQDDNNLLKKAYFKVLKVLMIIISPLLLGIIAISPHWITILFSLKWEGSIILIQVLALTTLIHAPTRTFSSLVLAKGKPELFFKWSVMMVFFNFFLIVTGSNLYGISGVVIFQLIGTTTLFYPSFLYFIKPFFGRCFDVYTIATVKPFIFSFFMAMVVYSFSRYNGESVFYLCRDVIFGAIIYGSFLIIFEKKFIIEIKNLILKK